MGNIDIHKLIILSFIFLTRNAVNAQVVHWSFGSYFFHNNKSLDFQITMSAPSKPGTYPVIFFITGFDGLCMTDFYTEFQNDLISRNKSVILIGLDKLQFIKLPDKEESIFEITLNWAIENINGLFNCDKTPSSIRNKVFPDNGPNGYTLMSHSSGAHPACLYMYKQCSSIKKLIWFDPVDGYDPFGWVKQYCTNPPKQLPVQIPSLIISTGLDPIPVLSFGTACKMLRFYC